MAAFRDNPRRILLIGLVILVLICLVGVLIFRIFTTDGEEVVGGNTPTPAQVATEEPTLIPTPAESAQPTATATQVVDKTPTKASSSVQKTTTPTPKSTTPSPTATPSKPVATTQAQVSIQVKPGPAKNLLKNGDFEQGFDGGGVATGWQAFNNGQVQAFYGRETDPYVESGASAQRLTLTGATAMNRYAGLSQQVEVIAGEVYTLTMHGQIHSGLGDVAKSSFGYRVQYALADPALKNWQNIGEGSWIELPWDEQPLNVATTQFYSYTTTVRPNSAKIALFVRAWNKWPDQSEAQYTFDSFSLVGPTLVTETVVIGASPAITGSNIIPPTPMTGTINRPLPVTGEGDLPGPLQDGRFWLGTLIVLLLAAGAVFRARWSY